MKYVVEHTVGSTTYRLGNFATEAEAGAWLNRNPLAGATVVQVSRYASRAVCADQEPRRTEG